MVRKSQVDALMPPLRQGILVEVLFCRGPGPHLSDLARRLGVRPSSLQRELAALAEADIIVRVRDGNRVRFEANDQCPFLPELRGLLFKTAGLVEVIVRVLMPLTKRIQCAFIHGSAARSQERSSSDIDLVLIGNVSSREAAKALRKAEQSLGRPVNPAIYSQDELREKLRARNHFLTSVLKRERVFVIGGPNELEEALGRSPGRAAQHQPGGDR